MWDVLGIIGAVVVIGGVFWLVNGLLKNAQDGDRRYNANDSGSNVDVG
jgi:hypothetical protein